MKLVAGAIVIAGAAYLIFNSSSAQASIPGPGALAYPVDNGPRGKLTADQAVALIDQVNAEEGLGLNPGDVLATMIIESGLDPTAYRYEAGVNDASYGLMQILSATAQQMGYGGDAAGLYDPLENTRYGMRYVRWVQDYLRGKLGRDPSYDEWTSGYNGGPGRVPGGWRSVAYTAKWAKARRGIAIA